MERYDPAGDLAPRDVVATAIVRERIRTGRPIYLSLAHLDADAVRARFPTIADACRQAGLDLARDLLPVSPAAHYMCGGVDTDLQGRTSIAGLFAAGEVACTGVHGANRLASNSLLEGLVFGARAAAAMRGAAAPAALRPMREDRAETTPVAPGPDVDVPALMFERAGLVRDAEGLAQAVAATASASAFREARLEGSRDPADVRAASIALVGHLVARAALRREESRGGHRRADFPVRDDVHWGIHVADRGASEGMR
jgi:L-aspartate oxidase